MRFFVPQHRSRNTLTFLLFLILSNPTLKTAGATVSKTRVLALLRHIGSVAVFLYTSILTQYASSNGNHIKF